MTYNRKNTSIAEKFKWTWINTLHRDFSVARSFVCQCSKGFWSGDRSTYGMSLKQKNPCVKQFATYKPSRTKQNLYKIQFLNILSIREKKYHFSFVHTIARNSFNFFHNMVHPGDCLMKAFPLILNEKYHSPRLYLLLGKLQKSSS